MAAEKPRPPEAVLRTWYKLVLELVRHTATYSPPVASRAFAYLGVTAFEAAASGNPKLRSLQGQLNGLDPLPTRAAGVPYDEGVIITAAMRTAVESFFSNTGPTGQRAMGALGSKLSAEVAANLPREVVARSE
ncbi:MAG: vanadium-dependent haloperoxidase, partial [Aestuariivirga sp.]